MIDPGYCQCGCGEKTTVSVRTDRAWGRVKGRPMRFVSGHHTRLSPIEYLVDERTGCWIWQRAKHSAGYGVQWTGGKLTYAHRIYYERFVGPIPEGLVIDHLCRTPACVNPEHLEAVSNAENSRRGKAAMLTGETVELLRADAAGGMSYRQLAEKYGLHKDSISKIVRYQRWRGIEATARA